MGEWRGSSRRSRLPDNWEALREKALRRDGNRCRQCGARANQVDHIRAGDDHSLANLQSLCSRCHASKSSAEGGRAVHKGKRDRGPKPWRVPKPQPGLRRQATSE